MARPTPDTPARILRAAEDLVIRDGVSHLTLEAAAQEAGVSKGGILYHFPSRAALVSAMVESFVVSFEADLVSRQAYSGVPGAFTRAYLEATLDPSEQSSDPRQARLGGALLAGMTSDPDLLQPLRERYDAWQASLEKDGLPEHVATVVRLAADGLWLADLFALAPLTGAARHAVGEQLLDLIAAGLASGRPSR